LTRVLVVCSEPIGPLMAGPAIRAYELARVLAGSADVTLAAPAPSASADPRIDVLEAGFADYDALLGAAAEHDVIVAQLLPPRLLTRVARLPARLAVDLYNPTIVEAAEAGRHQPPARARRMRAVVERAAAAHLAAADFVLCASERQRDLWLGGMGLRGLLEDDLLRADPAVRGFLAVVPFGVPAEPPRPTGALRRAFPSIGERDRVLLWGGGIWDWLDAETAIHATALLADREPPVHLVFPGVRRPALEARDEHGATARALRLADELGLAGRRVHAHDGWVPYEERGGWLLEADVGVTAHPDTLEARFAFRTRVLDYVWAGLPVVATEGDVLADLVAARGAGRTVAPDDPRAFADACAAALDDPPPPAALAAELRWDRVAAPLVEFALGGRKRPWTAHRRAALAAATAGQYAPIARETLDRHGPGFLAAKLARNARRALRRRR